jgi:hypothetical protein
MKGLEPRVERQLRRAQGRWRWLTFWRRLSLLLLGACALVLVAGLAVQLGWLRSAGAVAAAGGLILALLGIGLTVITATSATARRPRQALAAAVERAWSPFSDRLNTLVALEAARRDPDVAPYFVRIERQARQVVPTSGVPSPFPARSTVRLALGALVVGSLTVAYLTWFRPWKRLVERPAVAEAVPEAPVETAGLPSPPAESAAEVRPPWGEVRITEPGRDLKVTKVDVVPLTVEAAAEQALDKAWWTTTESGGRKNEHPLPPPAEPHYAVYKPILYVDELRLKDWDVVSYYAAAKTAAGRSHASDIYFLEVRPFREDLLKLPGGESGKGYQCLNKLTGLVERQRQILRETHRHEQQPAADPTLRRQDRRKLEEAEADLATATRHLYAEIASEMENAPIAEVLTHLARAEDWIEQARAALAADAPEVVPKEQKALEELAATRKAFHKAVSDNPDAFGDGGDDDADQTPVAELPDKLKEILELRDEEKAARELVSKALDEQRRIAQQAASGGPPSWDGLAERQDAFRKPLEQLEAGRSRAFRGAEREAAAATRDLKAAAEALRRKDEDAVAAQGDAVESLARLQEALGRERESRELTDAYRFKEAVEREARRMQKMSEQPGGSSDADAQRSAESARAALQGMKDVVEEKPGRDAFGPELRQSLSGQAGRDLGEKLDALARSRGERERGAAAGAAKQGLDKVVRAFDRSQPQAAKDLEADRLTPDEREALERALEQIEGLVARGEAGKPASPEDEARQRRELLLNLERALKERGGEARTNALLLEARKVLEKHLTAVEKAKLKELAADIERLRVETADGGAPETEPAGLRLVDPTRLPAAYRERIQKYFRKLSEQ